MKVVTACDSNLEWINCECRLRGKGVKRGGGGGG
jgi:hypothetical protein